MSTTGNRRRITSAKTRPGSVLRPTFPLCGAILVDSLDDAETRDSLVERSQLELSDDLEICDFRSWCFQGFSSPLRLSEASVLPFAGLDVGAESSNVCMNPEGAGDCEEAL